MSLLDVKDLRVEFTTQDGTVTAVNDLELHSTKAETLGTVGESGSGANLKRYLAELMGPLAKNGIISGSAKFEGNEISIYLEKALNKVRAEQIAMISPRSNDVTESTWK